MFGKVITSIIALSFFGVVGSLYMSSYGDPVNDLVTGNLFSKEGALLPCLYCWYARIFLYPILPLSLLAYIKNDKKITDYILTLSIPGFFLTLYHFAAQKIEYFQTAGCSGSAPCSDIQLEYFGFATIPFLATLAFLLMTILAAYNSYTVRKNIQKKQ